MKRNLAVCYDMGAGVEQNYGEAAKWYRKAAEQGNAHAHGNGVSRDYVQAYKWFSLAAIQGDDIAKKNLAMTEKLMTPEQIAEAQQSAREFVSQKEKAKSESSNSIAP